MIKMIFTATVGGLLGLGQMAIRMKLQVFLHLQLSKDQYMKVEKDLEAFIFGQPEMMVHPKIIVTMMVMPI